MERVILFGASVGGQRALQALGKGRKAVAFSDNSAAKHGTSFAGLPVIGPAQIPTTPHDRIVIASSYHREIRSQLEAMGIPADRIELFDTTARPASVPAARFPEGLYATNVREPFKGIFANLTLQCLIDHFDFKTVLDIGSGAGRHADLFEANGKSVTALDFGVSFYFKQRSQTRKTVIGDYQAIEFEEPFDCLWASHVLEHQPNANSFLRKMHKDLREGGMLAVTVPPLKHEIVGGHLSLWNAGLLLYNLVFAGFNCREAHVRKYAYNVSVIVQKRTIELPTLDYDKGDIDRLQAFLPAGLHEGFDGNIERLNWPWA